MYDFFSWYKIPYLPKKKRTIFILFTKLTSCVDILFLLYLLLFPNCEPYTGYGKKLCGKKHLIRIGVVPGLSLIHI